MHEELIRTVDEAEAIAIEAERRSAFNTLARSRFPDRSYEDGIVAMWDWLSGKSDENPYPPAGS